MFNNLYAKTKQGDTVQIHSIAVDRITQEEIATTIEGDNIPIQDLYFQRTRYKLKDSQL